MKKTDPISLLIADDREIFREGLQSIFMKIETVQLLPAATDSNELLALNQKYHPAILLLNAGLIEADWLTAPMLKEKFATARIIVFAINYNSGLTEGLQGSGIRVLSASAGSSEFIKAVKNEADALLVKAGPEGAIKEQPATKNSRNMNLSAKEIEVLELICNEYSSREISTRLHLSIRTIEGYRENIAKKTGARNIAGIVVYAIKYGLFKP